MRDRDPERSAAGAYPGPGARARALAHGPVRTFLALPAGEDGSSFYRLTQPFAELRRHTRHVTMIPAPGTQMPPPGPADLEFVDVAICQRPAGAMGAKSWDQMKGLTRRVYEVDDDLFASDPSGLPHLCDGMVRDAMAYCLASADMVTVSTPYLAELYAPLNPCIRVLPNYIHAALLELPRRATERVTVGYTGAASHLADMCAIQEPLSDVLAQHPDVDMAFFGIDYSPLLHRECLWSIWKKDLWDYYRTLSFDIGIAPLADIPFNRSKCIDSSMRISTNKGVIEAGAVKPGMKVWLDGWKTVRAAEYQQDREGFCITTSRGLQVTVTPEHRLLDGQAAWREARDLRVGDTLRLVQEDCPELPYRWVSWPADSRTTRAGDVEPMAFLEAAEGPKVAITETWGRILGLFTGDGHMAGKTAIGFSCDGQDADLIKMLIADLESAGFKATTEQVTTWGGEVLRQRSVRVSSAHLSRFLAGIGAARAHSKIGQRWERTLRVPDVIFRSGHDVRAAFLAGLFEADGHVSKSSSIAVTTKSEDLARGVHRLLWSIGVPSIVRHRSGPQRSPYADRTYWQVWLRAEEMRLFAVHVGFLSQRKQAKLAEAVDKGVTRDQNRGAMRPANARKPIRWTDEIVSVEPCMVTPVDIQVDGEAFSAAGIYSHNSNLKVLEYAARGIPCIATDMEPYHEFVRDGETGYLIRPGDHDGWRKRLTELIHDEGARAEMGAKAKEVAAGWTIQEHWREFEQVYEEACGSDPPALPQAQDRQAPDDDSLRGPAL